MKLNTAALNHLANISVWNITVHKASYFNFVYKSEGIPHSTELKEMETAKEVVIWILCNNLILQFLSPSMPLYSQMSSLKLTIAQTVALCSNTFLFC